MYGYNQGQGLAAATSMTSVEYTPKLIWYPLANPIAADMFQNTPVVCTSGVLAVAAATNPTSGSVQEFQYQTNAGPLPGFIQKYAPSGYAAPTGSMLMAGVELDPYVLYDMNVNSSTGAASTALNTNFDYVNPGSGSSLTGISSTQITANTGTAAANMKAIALSYGANNQWSVGGNFGYNNLLCKINNSTFVAGVA